ncbi:RNA-directed DNA polymerase from mobile element jockey-like protein [Pitangus sulphuratus]|nr:RNA-directed DNA polymerase from mobile element jockey-like protein [Pitangus sulphuratus]
MKQAQDAWDEYSDVRGFRNATRKAKVHLELNLAEDVEDNKKGFFKSINNKSNTREKSREVPEDWKNANVTPALKKDRKEDTGNYRPVRLASIPGKVMEQLILGAISKHMEDENVIRSSQHGFTKGKTCLTNLIAFYDGRTVWIDKQCVYLDFSKVLDTDSHDILIGKEFQAG